jgi:hypothetical protein
MSKQVYEPDWHQPDWVAAEHNGYWYWVDANKPVDFDGTDHVWRWVLENHGILPPPGEPPPPPGVWAPTPPCPADPTAHRERLTTASDSRQALINAERIAEAKWKLARARRRQAEPRVSGVKVSTVAALLVLSALMLIVGVHLLMQNNPWRTNPAPLTPIPSTSTLTVTPPRGGPGECGYPYSDECGRTSPTTTPTTAPPTAVTPCGSATHPNQTEACGDCQFWHGIDACVDPPDGTWTPTPTTTKPDEFPPDVMCDALKRHQVPAPGCPPTTEPTVPGVPGSRQGQTT